MGEMCGDNRFEIIKETKEYIIRATNIDTSKEEMEVLDSICFRLWQLGLTKRNLDKLKKMENTFSDCHICEIKARFNEIECDADKCETCHLGFESDVCLKNAFERKWELQEENFELRQKLNTEEECVVMLEKAIDKYKKVIKILKQHIEVYIYFGQSTINVTDYDLIQEEYNLLKEALEDE